MSWLLGRRQSTNSLNVETCAPPNRSFPLRSSPSPTRPLSSRPAPGAVPRAGGRASRLLPSCLLPSLARSSAAPARAGAHRHLRRIRRTCEVRDRVRVRVSRRSCEKCGARHRRGRPRCAASPLQVGLHGASGRGPRRGEGVGRARQVRGWVVCTWVVCTWVVCSMQLGGMQLGGRTFTTPRATASLLRASAPRHPLYI